MAKDDAGFSWMQLWVSWKNQPQNIQRQWMVWKVNPVDGEEAGLKPVLEDFMKNYPREIQDEVFKFSPPDVQKYFGYVPIPDKSEIVKPSRYNPNRQVAVLRDSGLSSDFKNRLQSILES